jgi:hypothetical protein
VKFGFHTQMNNWQHEISHAQLLDQIREQVQLCEALGFDAIMQAAWQSQCATISESIDTRARVIL